MLVAEQERSDAELVDAARAGNSEAFDRLTERHFSSAYAVAWMRLRDREAAEELAQEVLLRAWLGLDRLRDGAAFGGWVARMAHHLAVDWQRRRIRESRLVRLVSMEADVDAIADKQARDGRRAAEEAQEKAMLDRALAELPRDDRTLVLLHFAQDVGHREIARRLNVHHTTIGRRIEKALANLRRIVERQAAERRESHPLVPSPEARMHACAVVAAAAMLAPSAKASLVAAANAAAPAALLVAEAGVGAAPAVASGTKLGAAIKAVCFSKLVWVAAAVVGIGAGAASWIHSDGGPQAAARAEAGAAVARAERELSYRLGEDLPFVLGRSETVRVRIAEPADMKLESIVFEAGDGGAVLAHVLRTDGNAERLDVRPDAPAGDGLFFRYFNNEETESVEMLAFRAAPSPDGTVAVSLFANSSRDFYPRSQAIFADYFEGRASQRNAAAAWFAEADAAALLPSDIAHRARLVGANHKWTK